MARLWPAVLTGLALALPGSAAADPPCLPPAERGSAEPDAATLPAAAVDDLLPVAAANPNYRLLRERDAQCLAAKAAWLANLLDQEREEMAAAHPQKGGLCKLFCKPRDARAWKLRQTILYYAALDDRNRAAGRALELYFKASELEAQSDLVGLTRDALAGARKKSEELRKQGFSLPVDPATLRRQQLDADADATRVRAGLADVNARLKAAIGAADLPCDDWLWPAVEVGVSYEGVDECAAVALALEKRPELLLLRAVQCDLDRETLPVVRGYLASVSGLLGQHPTSNKHVVATIEALKVLLASPGGEKALRTGQVAALLADREKAVADEVRRAAADLHAKARLVALSRERALAARDQRRDAGQKAKQGGGSFLEVLAADLDWYKARATLVTDVAGWQTARVQLRAAQGVLVWECCGD